MVRKRQSTDVRKRQIINAAKKVIIKHGSEHLTVKRIASTVGISETAVYRHFKSKKEILSFLVEHVEKNLLGDIAAAQVGSSLEVINAVLSRHLSAVEQRRGISFQVIAEIISLGDKRLNKRITGTINKYIDSLQDLLEQGVKSGEVREDIDLEAAATVLFGMVQGLVNIWALGNYGFDPQLKFAAMWNTFREAIIKR